MRLRPLVFVSAAIAALAVAADKQFLEIHVAGSPPVVSQISDFGMSRVKNLEYADGDDPVTHKRPGRVKYSNIVLKRGFVARDPVDDWLNQAMDGKTERKSGSVIAYGRDKDESARYNFFEAWPCRIEFPGADSNLNERRSIEIELSSLSPIRPEQVGKDKPTVKQKAWLCSNFRLRIDGLDEPCSRVNKIDSFTWKQKVAGGDLDGDGVVDQSEFTDLVFELPIRYAPVLMDWFEKGDPRGGSLDYLDERGRPMGQLSFSSLEVFSVGHGEGGIEGNKVKVKCTVTGPVRWMAPESF